MSVAPPDANAVFGVLATVSTTFVGFSALIMSFRQTIGGGSTRLDSWITLIFVQLGFIVTAGALSAPLLLLAGLPAAAVWRLCSGAAGLGSGVFAATAPRMNSRNWYTAGLLTAFREFCRRSPHLSDQ